MSRRKRAHAGGHTNSERWLLTYADMITLLLALFIILFSISTVSKVKFKALAHEMSGGFNGTDADNRPPSAPPQAPAKPVNSDTKSLDALAAALTKYVRERRLTKSVAVHSEKRGVVVSLRTNQAMFASGSAVLEPGAGQLIHAVAGFLQAPDQRMRILKIEGNTDDVPISTPTYPSNWELSTSRAVAVTRHLSEDDGIAPDRLAAIGFAEWHPLAPNTSEANRLLNRRVDIVVLRLKDS
jgi:chemotaxis protein MotB